MKKLDMHVHCDSTEPKLIKAFADCCRSNSTVAALSGGLRYGGHDYAPNEKVLEICKCHTDWFVPLMRFDLWDKVDPDEVFRFRDSGARGLKFIYPYYEYDHDLYMPVYAAAEECELPVLFHTGCFYPSPADAVWKRPVLKNMNPLNLDRIARSFPKLRIIMAHLGTRIWRREAAELVRYHPNLYTDLAGCGAWMGVGADEFAQLFAHPIYSGVPNTKLYGKLIFGSDSYVSQPTILSEATRYYEMLLQRLNVPQEVHEAVMGKTAAEWLGITL
jgi:predicted TIM-barrel fold metal-dependent hydrolase